MQRTLNIKSKEFIKLNKCNFKIDKGELFKWKCEPLMDSPNEIFSLVGGFFYLIGFDMYSQDGYSNLLQWRLSWDLDVDVCKKLWSLFSKWHDKFS